MATSGSVRHEARGAYNLYMKIAVYYFTNGKASRSLGTSYNDYVILDSVRIRRPLNSHEELTLDLTLDKADLGKTPSGTNLDGFHILRYSDGSTPALSDIIYTFYVNRVQSVYDRDGGATVSVNCVSGTFFLNYVTTNFGSVTNKYITHLIRDKLPSSGSTNYTTQLSLFRPEFNVSKGVYVSSGSFFCQSAMDILQDFVDSGAAKLWRTTWDTTSGNQGRNKLDIVFADENTNTHTDLVDIIGSDLGTLESFFETPDEVNTVYMVAPHRAGTSTTVTKDIYSYQILYDAGIRFFSKPTVKTKPLSQIQGTPSYDASDKINFGYGSSNGGYTTMVATKEESSSGQHIIALKSGSRSIWVSTNGGSSFTEYTNRLNSSYTSLKYATYDDGTDTLFVLGASSHNQRSNVSVYSYTHSSRTLTYRNTTSTDAPFFYTIGQTSECMYFANNILTVVWNSNVVSPADVADIIFPSGGAAYTFNTSTYALTKSIINNLVIEQDNMYGMKGAIYSREYDILYLIQSTDGHTDTQYNVSYPSWYRGLAFTKLGERKSAYDFTLNGNANTIGDGKSAFMYDDHLYVERSTQTDAYSILVSNPDTTTTTLTVGEGNVSIDDYDAIWDGNRTLQLNSKHLATDKTRYVEMVGNAYETRPVKVKIDTNTEVAITVNTRETTQTNIINEGKRRLKELRSTKLNARLEYNTRYQPSDRSFFSPLPGDRIDVSTGKVNTTSVNYDSGVLGGSDSAGTSDPINMGNPSASTGIVREQVGNGYVYKFTGEYGSAGAHFIFNATFNQGVAFRGRFANSKPDATNIQTHGGELFSQGTTNNSAEGTFNVSFTKGSYFWVYPSATRTVTNRRFRVTGTLETPVTDEYTITEINETILQDEIIRELSLQETTVFNISREIKNYEKIIEDSISDVTGVVDPGVQPL